MRLDSGRLLSCSPQLNLWTRQAVNVHFTTHSPQPALRHVVTRRNHALNNQKRSLFTHVSPFILVPSVFAALLVGHWIHKCLLMVLFQNKIIYMPSLPPGSRRERLHHYSKTWAGVSWDQRQVKSLDGTQLTVAIARPASSESVQKQQTRTIVLYFQGNGASIPPRTPMLSNVLRSAAEKSPNHWLLAALSYRGYWTSSGRAHQRGIEQDAEAFVNWAVETYGKDAENTELILWGQSIGAGVAAYAASKYLESTSDIACKPTLNRLVLETPFVSIKSMLAAIYPDWWVPYKHLWPFLRSRWDSQDALRKIASSQRPPKILMLVAARDEVVPRVQSDQLESLCKHLHLQVTRKNVLGALHTQATSLEQGGKAISTWMRDGKLH